MTKGIKKWLKYSKNIYKIIIYGSGVYGKLTYDFLKEYKNINIVGWLDKNYNKIPKNEYSISVSSPDTLGNLDFDYIIIAVKTERLIKEICDFIKNNGGNEEQIILIDENEFEECEKIQFFEDEDFRKLTNDWNDYTYLRNKYGKYVEYKITKTGNDSGITWLLWFQGWDNAPDIVIKCRDSIRKYGGSREIICLDKESFPKYIDIPKDIEEMYKNGIIANAHYSDIIRLELLKKYGGLWIDATILLTDKLDDYITTGPLFLYQFPTVQPRIISNWLIYAYSNNMIIKETLKLVYRYWRTEKKVINYFFMHYLFRVVSNIYYKEWQDVPYFPNSLCNLLQREFNNIYNEKRMEQILKLSSVHKLTYKVNITTENSFYDYILNKI